MNKKDHYPQKAPSVGREKHADCFECSVVLQSYTEEQRAKPWTWDWVAFRGSFRKE